MKRIALPFRGNLPRMRLLALLALLALPAACGAASSFSGSCNISGLGICSDYDSLTVEDTSKLRMDCALVGDGWSLTACSHTGVVGGCHLARDTSGTQTSWYAGSSGYSASSVMSTCSAIDGGTFVMP
jgi:hypothetical protein